MSGPVVYLTGQPPKNAGPLARYLPPIPDGIAAAWLSERIPAGSWVLDPFGAAPRLAVEMARAGYRVLVAANNPVARFLLEMAARPPGVAELQAALADLSATYKGEDRIEPHLRSLYLTECAQCRQEVMAEAFVWERGAAAPSSRIYRCPNCGEAGEHPATDADIARATRFAAGGLHRARALERVAPLEDPDRPHAEEALAVYLPRAVYALFTLINKLESIPAARRSHLTALLLSACDQANTLWPHPTARARPRQLTVPPRFRENNVWLALEEAISQWASDAPALPLVTWPEHPPDTGGISVFEGRLKDLGEEAPLGQLPIAVVLAALPRPNQAYWTLSALWAGWLWGRESAAPFKSVLRRRRYDWAWHSTALHAALSSLAPLLQPGTSFLGLIGEAEPGFISAAVLAARMTGFDLSGMALRAEEGQAQMVWQSVQKQEKPIDTGPAGNEADFASLIQDLSQASGQAYLCERGQPASYLYLHAAALSALESFAERARSTGLAPAEALGQVQTAIQKAFTFRGGFIRYGGSEHSLEVGQWWLRSEGAVKRSKNRDQTLPNPPLADRVEMALVRYLQKHSGCTLAQVDSALCTAFPGLITPEFELVQACLESYAEQDPQGSDRWRLRSQDAPKVRRADLETMRKILTHLGNQLGYEVAEKGPLLWQKPGGELAYVFYLLASAVIGEIVFAGDYPPQLSILVIPGGRAGLLTYKMDSNARLNQTIKEGWRLVKYRQVRRMAENQSLTSENLDEQLLLDPLTRSEPQIPLL